LIWPSGCEEQRVPIFGTLFDDLADLRFKTHVEHAICLIDNKFLQAFEINGITFRL
jgi:hypothetical protein